jgi:hypothetical protein
MHKSCQTLEARFRSGCLYNNDRITMTMTLAMTLTLVQIIIEITTVLNDARKLLISCQ